MHLFLLMSFFIFASFFWHCFFWLFYGATQVSDGPGRTRLLWFPFWQSNFIMLCDAGLQYEFIQTFLKKIFVHWAFKHEIRNNGQKNPQKRIATGKKCAHLQFILASYIHLVLRLYEKEIRIGTLILRLAKKANLIWGHCWREGGSGYDRYTFFIQFSYWPIPINYRYNFFYIGQYRYNEFFLKP